MPNKFANMYPDIDTPQYKRMKALEKKRDYKIAMANAIIDNMRMGLSAKQQDVLDYMLKEIKPDDTPDTRYTISIREYCEENNIDYRKNGKNDKDIQDAVKSLKGGCKWIKVNDNGDKDLITWFCGEKYIASTNSISYRIDESVAPYLFDLVKEGYYTSYEYRQSSALNGKYTKTLFRILVRHLNAGNYTPFLPIDELKQQLDAEKYTNFKDFRRWILKNAEEEINEKTFLYMEWDKHIPVNSRAVSHISFKLRWIDEDSEEGEARKWKQIAEFGEDGLYDAGMPFPIRRS